MYYIMKDVKTLYFLNRVDDTEKRQTITEKYSNSQ